jgi:hypothetical protein
MADIKVGYLISQEVQEKIDQICNHQRWTKSTAIEVAVERLFAQLFPMPLSEPEQIERAR